MDLYGSSDAAIQMGNARRQQVRDMNDRIAQHNKDVSDKIAGLKDQEATTSTVKDIEATGKALWTGSGMPGKVKAYQDYRAAKLAGTAKGTNVVENTAATQSADSQSFRQKLFGKQEIPAPTTATEEGGLSRVATSATKEAATDVGESIASKVGGAAGTALKTGIKDGAEELGTTLLGKAAKGAGALGGLATGGYDIYEDVKAGGIAGNNNWEKAGNILQIGGAAADIVGTIFPPAALLGGGLDIASTATDEIGQKSEEGDKQADLDKQGEDAQESTVSAPIQATIATGRVQ